MIFYYDRISVKEMIDTETYEHCHDFVNESVSKKCNGCCVLLYNKNSFNYKERTCDRCYKILLNTEVEPRSICIIWWNNCKYRLLTTLKSGQSQRLLEKKNIKDRYGYINIENRDNSVKA